MQPTCIILLVEDDSEDAFFVRRALEKLGFEGRLEHVRDVEAAKVSLIDASKDCIGELPSIVIADSSVAGHGSGVDLLEWMRNRAPTKAIPFVILAGEIKPQTKQRAEEAGVELILKKSPDFSETTEHLRQVILRMPKECREWLK